MCKQSLRHSVICNASGICTVSQCITISSNVTFSSSAMLMEYVESVYNNIINVCIDFGLYQFAIAS